MPYCDLCGETDCECDLKGLIDDEEEPKYEVKAVIKCIDAKFVTVLSVSLMVFTVLPKA